MNYHDITTCDMLNGDGLRVVLWVSGCEIHCKNCQNPITWDCNGGLPFTEETKKELFSYLEKDYIHGITFSGGHPLHKNNVEVINRLICEIKKIYPDKDIWVYTGYTFEDIMTEWFFGDFISDLDLITRSDKYNIILNSDVLVDGMYIEELKDNNAHWVGSTNQRVIDIPKTFESIEMEMRRRRIPPLREENIEYYRELFKSCIILHD